MKHNSPCALLTLVLLATFSTTLTTAFGQGALTPPGAPAPTMKSLDQIEARTIVNTANTPGDANNLFIISQPGSYYLTTNLTGVSGVSGIEITANNVTLDLNGFVLQQTSGLGTGIAIPNAQTNITVRNGTVTGWANNGVYGVATNSSNFVFERLNVSANGLYGIRASGTGVAVHDCNCGNNGSGGIYVGNGTVRDCHAEYNIGNNIQVGDGSEVRGCVVVSSTGNNSSSGIYAGVGCKIQDCVANGDYDGIAVGEDSSIIGCNVVNNRSQGIYVANNNVLIKDCSVCTNGNGIGSYTGSTTNITVSGCMISKNVFFGLYLFSAFNSNVRDCNIGNNNAGGLHLSSNSHIRDCNIFNNNGDGLEVGSFSAVSGCVVNGNTGEGINGDVLVRIIVEDCTVEQNTIAGIDVGGDSMITGCHVSANGLASAHGAGIYTLTGSGSRVDGNQVRDNYGYGIQSSSTDLIIRNYVGNNSTNFYTTSGANFGPIETPSAMTNALGNIAY
jgi:hypothetical protein